MRLGFARGSDSNTAGVSIASGASASHTFNTAGLAFNWLYDRDTATNSAVTVTAPTSTPFNLSGTTGHFRYNARGDLVTANTQVTATDAGGGGNFGSAWWRVLLPLAGG